MNFPAILNILGHVIKYELLLLLIPFAVALFYGQGMLVLSVYNINNDSYINNSYKVKGKKDIC